MWELPSFPAELHFNIKPMKKTVIKAATLVLFISLVGSFVLYRSGIFGNGTTSYSMSPNGSVINSSTDETETTADSITKNPTIISSSKVMIIKDPILPIKDTTKTSAGESYILKNKDKIIISSSKSGRMLDADDVVQIFQDSLRTDSLKNNGNE